MVVTMPARRRDLRSWRYSSQLRSPTSRLADADGVDEEAASAIAVGRKGPLLFLAVQAEVESALVLRASAG